MAECRWVMLETALPPVFWKEIAGVKLAFLIGKAMSQQTVDK